MRSAKAVAALLAAASAAGAADYQWSTLVPPDQASTRPAAETPRAFLWIPPNCGHVRAVVFGEHNMLEENILEDARFRTALGELDVATVWVSPSFDAKFDTPAAFERLDATMQSLAKISGYDELATAPIAPIGHSAHGSMPWNFAARRPDRTLCALSIHGDAPATPFAGYGPATPTWDRDPDALSDVPGLMVMGEYEWIETRLAPALVFRFTPPKAPVAMLAEPGGGHFAAGEKLVPYLAMFLKKCVEQRLNNDGTLRPVDASKGWRVQRWTPRLGRTVQPAPAGSYGGDDVDAFWAFDEEMARATHEYHADRVGLKPQLVGFVQDGQLAPFTATHAMVNLTFQPAADGETFKLEARFLDRVPSMQAGEAKDGPGKNNLVRWTRQPAGTPLRHPDGPIAISRIEEPVEQLAPDTFRLAFDRGYTPRQQMWFAATHAGDAEFTSAVQQSAMNVPRNDEGAEQTITFAPIADAPVGDGTIELKATSTSGLPVRFYVRDGPAEVRGDRLTPLPIPPRARLPISVTVVAYQPGRSTEPLVKRAAFVEQRFSIGND